MKLLITGGAGFIGSNFLKHLASQYSNSFSSITVLDDLTYAGRVSNFAPLKMNEFHFIKGDICDIEACLRATTGVDCVVHFAAESHVDRSINGPIDFVRTNVLGTANLLEACLKNQVTTFLHVSTDEVYGSIKNGSWTEESPILPNSPYAASKASSDLIALSFHKTYGIDVRITRSSNNYGANQNIEKVIPRFITNALRGMKLPIYGTGTNIRDWIHVTDHCEGIVSAIMSGRPGEIYNLGGNEELTNLQLAMLILSFFDMDDSFIEFIPDRLGHDFRYSLNSQKARQLLDFKNSVVFLDGLSHTIEWYRENPDWWQE